MDMQPTTPENWKPTNPKDMVGIGKVPYSSLPWPVVAECAVGMFEGTRKYGRSNYRVEGVLFSTYFDATIRHMTAAYEGEEIDPASGLPHVTKAITSLMVLRDAMMNGNLKDDRPVRPTLTEWLTQLNAKTQDMIDKYPNAVPPFTHKKL